MPRMWWSTMPSTTLKVPQPARMSPKRWRAAPRSPRACASTAARRRRPSAIQVLRGTGRPRACWSHAGDRGRRGVPSLVSMWCHCRIWCSTMPSKKPPRPMPRKMPGRVSGRTSSAGRSCAVAGAAGRRWGAALARAAPFMIVDPLSASFGRSARSVMPYKSKLGARCHFPDGRRRFVVGGRSDAARDLVPNIGNVAEPEPSSRFCPLRRGDSRRGRADPSGPGSDRCELANFENAQRPSGAARTSERYQRVLVDVTSVGAGRGRRDGVRGHRRGPRLRPSRPGRLLHRGPSAPPPTRR